MGIYNNGLVYGISCRLLRNENYICIFEEKFDQEMKIEQIQYVKSIYDKVPRDEKEEYDFCLYLSCSDTYGPETYMDWWSISESILKDFMDGKNVSKELF